MLTRMVFDKEFGKTATSNVLKILRVEGRKIMMATTKWQKNAKHLKRWRHLNFL